MISTNEFKNGLAITINGDLYVIAEYQHVKPGKGGAFVRTKLRRLKGGSVLERTFRVGEKFQEAYIEKHKFQFLYRDGPAFHFMDLGNFEQLQLTEGDIGPSAGFLKENMEVEGEFHGGDLIQLALPIFVDLKIEATEPGIRGDTSKGGNKPATLETGATIQVPLFVNSGDVIRIDTRTGAYVSRA